MLDKTLKMKVPYLIISDLQRTSSHAPTLSFGWNNVAALFDCYPSPPRPNDFLSHFFTALVWTDAAASRCLPSSGIRHNVWYNAATVNYINAKSAAQPVPSSKRLQTMYITSSGKFVVFGPTLVMNGFMKEGAPWPCSPLGATFPLHLSFLSTVLRCLVINRNLKYTKNMKYHAEQWSKDHFNWSSNLKGMNQNLPKGVMCKAILSRAGVQLFNVNKKVAHSSQKCQHYTG